MDAVEYVMSRHSKPRQPVTHVTPSPPRPAHAPQPPHARNGATPPAGDATAELVALRALIEETRRELNARLDALADSVERLLPAHAPALGTEQSAAKRPAMPDVRVGDEVYVPKLGGTHTVVEISPSSQTFKVQYGQTRVRVRRDEMWALDGDAAAPKTETPPPPRSRPDLSAGILEIDLHGFSERDALITLELFLHHAFAQRTSRVRVIHGKGDGVLRAAVRRELARNALVRGIDAGPHFQGDDGVTLAELDL